MKSILALVVLPLALAGCHIMQSGPSLVGSGKLKTEERKVEGFTKIKLDTPAEVNIVVGEKAWVGLTADDNYLRHVITDVDGSTLKIRNKNGSYTNTTLRIAIKVPNLEGVHINGSGNISIQNLKANEFEAEIDGSGSIEAKGTAKEVATHINGSGTINLRDVKTEQGRAKINGSGEIKLNANKNADAKINGSGTIRVSGGGEVSQSVNGSGEIVRE